MARDRPPVWRSRWKRSDSRCRCSKVSQRHPPHRALLHGGEHRVAQLAEAGGGDAQQAVADDQRERHGEHRAARPSAPAHRRRAHRRSARRRSRPWRRSGTARRATTRTCAPDVAARPEIGQQRADGPQRRSATRRQRGRLAHGRACGMSATRFKAPCRTAAVLAARAGGLHAHDGSTAAPYRRLQRRRLPGDACRSCGSAARRSASSAPTWPRRWWRLPGDPPPARRPARWLRPQALPGIVGALATAGHLRWRGEAFDVRADPDGPVLAEVDRGALPAFGHVARSACT